MMRRFFKKHTVIEWAVYFALAFIFLSCKPSWAIQIKNGSTAVVSFLARNTSNLTQYITGLTTGTTNITVYRNNLSALSMTTNTLSEVANGLYRITLNATHTNTTGELVYRINWTSGDYWGRDDVVDNLLGEIYAKANAANDTVGNANYGNAQLVRATTPANKLDINSNGEAGIDWGNVGNKSTANNLSGTFINSLNDRTGFSLVASAIQAIWEYATRVLTGAVDINSNQDLTDTLSNITTVKGYVDTEVADTLSNVSAVKAKTDKLTFDDSNRTIANSTALNLSLGY